LCYMLRMRALALHGASGSLGNCSLQLSGSNRSRSVSQGRGRAPRHRIHHPAQRGDESTLAGSGCTQSGVAPCLVPRVSRPARPLEFALHAHPRASAGPRHVLHGRGTCPACTPSGERGTAPCPPWPGDMSSSATPCLPAGAMASPSGAPSGRTGPDSAATRNRMGRQTTGGPRVSPFLNNLSFLVCAGAGGGGGVPRQRELPLRRVQGQV
jgi:hypothetical protein